MTLAAPFANDAGNHENMNNDTPESTAANDDNMFQNQTTSTCKPKYPLSRSGPNGRMRSFLEVWFKRFWWLEYSETKDAAYCLPCYLFKPSDQQDVNANHVNEPPQKDVHNSKAVNLDSLIRDPGTRPSILSYPSDQQDEIRQTKDAAYCLPCYLFNKKPVGRVGSDRFTKQGFNKWKKLNGGNDCAFIIHVGKTPASTPNYSLRCYEALKNQSCHIENVIEKQIEKEVIENRLRLKTTIESVKWLTVQTCGLRGSDERPGSKNQGNLLELVKLIASYNKDVENVVLGKAPQNAKYTSPDVQKEILRIIAKSIQHAIRDEIGNAKFCLIVDESRDESKKEQMAIVVRFVDRKGNIKERFLDLIHVKDTTSLTLMNEILSSLSYHKLDVQNIRGQGYDGASNMRGEWNGLQALILKECPYAYYVHCFAHQLQLALVSASKEVAEVHKFFKNLNIIVNVISSSCKRNDQLIDAQVRCSTTSQKGDAAYCLEHLLSFDFVIGMHIMKEIMEITDKLCQALQHKSQDIINALALNNNILIPDMNATYRNLIQSCKKNNVTVEHHYRVDVFYAAIDRQLVELNSRFNESVIELLRISVALDPRKSFNIDDICKLVMKYYPLDFTDQEKIQLKAKLQHFKSWWSSWSYAKLSRSTV
ncbi:zinc finger MYM-type protein 1-like protein [Tanacetum coccineum]